MYRLGKYQAAIYVQAKQTDLTDGTTQCCLESTHVKREFHISKQTLWDFAVTLQLASRWSY